MAPAHTLKHTHALKHTHTDKQRADERRLGDHTHAVEHHTVKVQEAMPRGCSHIYSFTQRNTRVTTALALHQ